MPLFIVMVIVSFCWPSFTFAALLPPFFLDSVVALGNETLRQSDPSQPPKLEWVTIGTGFFYGDLAIGDPDPAKRQYRIFLVTAKHVIEEYRTLQAQNPQLHDLRVRVNPKDYLSSAQEFPLPSQPGPNEATWFFHPDPSIDIAVRQVDFSFLKTKGIEPTAFRNNQDVADRKKMKDLGLSPGDGTFVLGFPMNIAGRQRNYVIVRQGCIARIGEMLDRASPSYLLDSFVFPGNSGGPVVIKPEVFSIEGTKAVQQAYFIGIVTSYQTYQEAAISPQTKRTRVIFEENSGLADVLPPDYVDETIKAWEASISPASVPTSPSPAKQ
jgi:hypothetical protein